MSNSQRIKIYADINASGSPENYISKSKIEIRNANPVKIEVVFLENGAYADVASATGAVAEILDVGDFNSPPPSEPLLLARSLSALQSPFEAGAACQKSADSTCNAVFEFPSAAAGFLRDDENFAQRYLSVRLCMPDNSEISYADGWIFVRRNFSSDPNFNPISSPKYITKTETEALVRDAVAGSHEHLEYLEKSENLSDLSDAASARSNLNVYAKTETYSSLEIDDKEALDLKKASNLSDLSDAASARSNLNVYAKTETYSSLEIDDKEALDLKKASNLSDLADVATARTNLNVYSKSETYSATEVDAKVQASAQALACSKQSRGELWFAAASFASQTNAIASLPFSVCAEFYKADFDAISSSNPEYLFTNMADGSTATSGVYVILKGEDGKTALYLYKDSSAYRIIGFDISSSLRDGKNSIVFTAKLKGSGRPLLQCYLNGVLVGERDGDESGTTQNPSQLAIWSDGTISPNIVLSWHKRLWGYPANSSFASNNNMRYSRLMAFNFDISASGAAYSLADYQNGVDVPPALKDPLAASKCLLELENYTYLDGASKKIFDVSGGNNDATITGSVAGTRDVSVKRLIDFITAQNS